MKKLEYKFMPCPDVILTDNDRTTTVTPKKFRGVMLNIGTKIRAILEVTSEGRHSTPFFQVTIGDPHRHVKICPHDSWCTRSTCPSSKISDAVGYSMVDGSRTGIFSFMRPGKVTLDVVVDGNRETVRQIQVPSATWEDKLFLKSGLYCHRSRAHKARIIPDDGTSNECRA